MSDWLVSSKLSYTEVFSKAGFMMILFDGKIFIMGIKGKELGVNEWPTHLTVADMGGNT